MTTDQLVQIVLDAYSAKTDFKEYFDFFLNPDVKKLTEKHIKLIDRELNKSKWGYSKARVSVIKKVIKDFIGFNPGPEAVLDMMFITLQNLGYAERYLNFNETQMKYVERLSRQIMEYAEVNHLFNETRMRVEEMISYPNFTIYFRQHIKNGVENP